MKELVEIILTMTLTIDNSHPISFSRHAHRERAVKALKLRQKYKLVTITSIADKDLI